VRRIRHCVGSREGSLRERCVAILPGQYFDAETGLHQNRYRDYDPGLGRYLQSDPIGLRAGVSTYGYVRQNPLGTIDPLGLYSCNPDGTVLPTGVPDSPAEGAAAWAQDQFERGSKNYTKAANTCGGPGAWKCNCFVRDAFIKGGGLTLEQLPKYYRPDGAKDDGNFARANDLGNRSRNQDTLGMGTGAVGDIVAYPAPGTGHAGVIGCDGRVYSAREHGIAAEYKAVLRLVYWWNDRDTVYRSCCDGSN